MSNQHLINQLKRLRQGEVNPRAEWLNNNRRQLLIQIRNTLPPAAEPSPARWENVWNALAWFLPKPVVFNVIRPVAVLLVVALVATSSLVATVDAAYEAVPGDVFYPAKRGLEKTQVAVAALFGNKNTETKLHLEFAKRRATETKKIFRRDDGGAKAKQMETAIADLKSELTTVGTGLEEIKHQAPAAEMAKNMKQNTESISAVLQEVKNDLLVSATTTAGDALLGQVNATKNLVKDVNVKAVEVLVTTHLAGDKTLSPEEMKSTLDKTLATMAHEATESKDNVAGVQTAVESVKNEVRDFTKEVAAAHSQAATSTKELTEKITQVANQTVAAVLRTEAVSAAVDKTVSAAKELVGSGDLVKAMEKIKEASEATKEAEKISDTALAKAQTVLPVVQAIKETAAPGTTTSSPDSFLLLSGGLNAVTTTKATTVSGTEALKAPGSRAPR